MTDLRDIAALAADRRLGRVLAHVVDAGTGAVVLGRGGSTPAPTASVLKLLTSVAALEHLGPDYRAPTTVRAGARPDEVVLVGGGDLTLSRLPSGCASFYPGAAHLDVLARQVRERLPPERAGTTPVLRAIVLDSSLFAGPAWLDSWDEQEERIDDGSMSYVTALQVDGDRDDPAQAYNRRGDDPALRAGHAFSAELGGAIELMHGTAAAGAATLGRVESPSVGQLIAAALPSSDNTVMEMLARLAAIACGAGARFADVHAAVTSALRRYGPVPAGLRIADGSGLSPDNAVPPDLVTRLMAAAWRRERSLGTVYDALPVSGGDATGTLRGRFTGASAVVADSVRAKTGWIIGAYTMAGLVLTKTGRPLAFAIFAIGDVEDSARDAIDAFVAGLHELDDAVNFVKN